MRCSILLSCRSTHCLHATTRASTCVDLLAARNCLPGACVHGTLHVFVCGFLVWCRCYFITIHVQCSGTHRWLTSCKLNHQHVLLLLLLPVASNEQCGTQSSHLAYSGTVQMLFCGIGLACMDCCSNVIEPLCIATDHLLTRQWPADALPYSNGVSWQRCWQRCPSLYIVQSHCVLSCRAGNCDLPVLYTVIVPSTIHPAATCSGPDNCSSQLLSAT